MRKYDKDRGKDESFMKNIISTFTLDEGNTKRDIFYIKFNMFVTRGDVSNSIIWTTFFSIRIYKYEQPFRNITQTKDGKD